jgi:hypothetical protein
MTARIGISWLMAAALACLAAGGAMAADTAKNQR